MLRRLGLALALCCLATAAVAGTVYKWMDRSGQVHYTDRPPRGADARIIEVIQQGTVVADAGSSTTDATEAASGSDAASDTSSDTASDTTSAEMKKAVEADVAKTRAEQCRKAQDRYKNYVESYRVYRDKDGKREYLNSRELDDARVRARQDVDKYCGGK